MRSGCAADKSLHLPEKQSASRLPNRLATTQNEVSEKFLSCSDNESGPWTACFQSPRSMAIVRSVANN